eukprot:gene1662-2870_t
MGSPLHQRMVQNNINRVPLHNIMVWWDSLSVVEKSSRSKKETLVEHTEKVVDSMLQFARSIQDKPDEDDSSSNQAGSTVFSRAKHGTAESNDTTHKTSSV